MDLQAAKTVAITVLAFLVCYIPPILVAVWGRLRSDESWWGLAQFSPLISSGINPIIYCFRTRRFRSALKQLLKDPCGRRPFRENNQVQMAQREIPHNNPSAANNRITNEHEKASLAPRAHVIVDQRACCSTAAQEERELGMQHDKETETDRSDSQSLSGLRKRSNAVPLQHQETGRVKLAWMENHHIDSSEANSSSGEESPELCGDLNTQQQGTVELHPIQRQ